ncbi:MAG TPA: antibiotic biosynthesis monooxygenase [Polyangium sp.]|nr:antibiotic biosynthesis monooxygenase [Polyangium sp.]
MYVVCVRIQVHPQYFDEFIEATRENCEHTRKEPGNVRFDVLRGADDPGRFFLYEVYEKEDDFRQHQQTSHYLAWREKVAPMMATPRIGEKYANLFPDPWT